MKKQLFFLSLAFMALVFSACSGGKRGVFGATSSGRAYEILVVLVPACGSVLPVGLFLMCLIRMFRGFPSPNALSA